MFLFPRRRQGPKNGTSVLTSNTKAFWPFGDAHDAPVLADSTGRGNSLTPYLRIQPTTCAFRIGRNAGTGGLAGQQVYGSLKGWGRWERILTSGEKSALNGKEYWPFSTTTSLQDVKAYYKLDEVGGSSSYADATGRGNTLTASGTTTQVTGPAGGADKATNFTSPVFLERTSPGPDLQSDQANVTVAGWVKLDSKPAGGFMQQCFWCQLLNNTPDSGFNVYYDPTSDRFALDNDGGDGQPLNRGALVLANNFGSPALSTWYFVIAEFDVTNNQITISVNNGTPDVLGHILQPTQVPMLGGTGSLFEANPAASFWSQLSGWDVDVSGPIIGNSRASMTPTADVSIGNNAKTVWGWLWASDTSTTQTVAGMDGGSGATTDWAIRLASNQLTFVFGNEMVTTSIAFTDTTSPHLVVAWFDKVANKIHIDLDNGSASSNATGPATPHTVSQPLIFGSNVWYQFRGSLMGWGIADGTPSGDDLAYLWNDGLGITLP